jgi:hypothetical protein
MMSSKNVSRKCLRHVPPLQGDPAAQLPLKGGSVYKDVDGTERNEAFRATASDTECSQCRHGKRTALRPASVRRRSVYRASISSDR